MSEKKLYRSSETIQLPGTGCAGCGKCCRSMGDTIVLDPWDADRLAKGLGKPFAALMDREVDLHVEEGLILPHLRMQANWGLRSARQVLSRHLTLTTFAR